MKLCIGSNLHAFFILDKTDSRLDNRSSTIQAAQMPRQLLKSRRHITCVIGAAKKVQE